MVKNFIRRYISEIKSKFDLVDHRVISDIIVKLNSCEKNNATVYVIGNGGSAATASHIQNDLGVGLKGRGLLNLNIVSLCDNLSVITAIANDVGYESVFFYQIKDVIKKNDLLIAISCSGNSKNIIKAVKYSKDIGATVIGMTGFDGGELKKLADISYHIETKEGDYGVVEDMHMMLDHMIYTYYIEGINKNDR